MGITIILYALSPRSDTLNSAGLTCGYRVKVILEVLADKTYSYRQKILGFGRCAHIRCTLYTVYVFARPELYCAHARGCSVKGGKVSPSFVIGLQLSSPPVAGFPT